MDRSRDDERYRAAHASVRARIVEVAASIVQRQGLLHLTLTSLGKELGVARTVIYWHFADVFEVMREWLEVQGSRDLHELLRAQDLEPHPRLCALLRVYIKQRQQHGRVETAFRTAMPGVWRPSQAQELVLAELEKVFPPDELSRALASAALHGLDACLFEGANQAELLRAILQGANRRRRGRRPSGKPLT